MQDFSRLAAWMIPRRGRVHLTIFIITILMLPGALTALEPIDIESYDLDSPEIEAQDVIYEEFSAEEEVLGFVISLRDPKFVEDSREDVPLLSGNIPDYSNLIPNSQIHPYPGDSVGVEAPVGGILNLTVLREIDRKATIGRSHVLGSHLTPIVNDVTGSQTEGIMAAPDIFRSFMSDDSILTKEGISPFGTTIPPKTQWDDCGSIECLDFDDPELTQAHIDLAAHRLANNSNGNFLRWLSLDRAFVPDETSDVFGPIEGVMSYDGNFTDAVWGPGRWSATSTWLLIQLDKSEMENSGWTFSWKDAHPEKKIDWPVVGGYIVHGSELLLHPPDYNDEYCQKLTNDSAPCAFEWAIMHMEGLMRSTDHHVVTLLVASGVNIEVNREVQSSANLILIMGVVVLGILWLSLRRITDVMIVSVALGGSLLWMQGLIGHVSNLGDFLDMRIISRSQFSNLLPILVLALGIDDSLHALHRYKEERVNGAAPEQAASVTISKVGRAILLSTVTTMAAFASNLFSDIAALRSFGIEAALGVFAAFVLTGIWAPLVRLSVDLQLEKSGRLSVPNKDQLHLVPKSWLRKTTTTVAGQKAKWVVAFLALIITIPAAIGMANLEGDFKVEDFLDETSDLAVAINLINERFYNEGEPAEVLIEGDVLDPRVFAAIDEARQNLNRKEAGLAEKVSRKPNGQVDIHGIDNSVYFLIASMAENRTPFEEVGWNATSADHGVGCGDTGAPLFLPDVSQRGCLAFFYGFLSLYGVPETSTIPQIPPSVIALYIYPDQELDPMAPHLTIDGEEPTYSRTLLRFGVTSPENFPTMQPFLDRLADDLAPLTNFTSGDYRVRGDVDKALDDEENPLSWVMWTGRPITRFVAADAMQSQMQSSLLLGALFVILTLWWGFRSLTQSLLTTAPILLVVVWLYGLIAASGGNLNLVTVAIAAISLGVGIDYCIHVTERYREERFKGATRNAALSAVGGASGLALVGSAVSDISGFMIISLSPMGLFSLFGIYSSAMIFLSLIASMVLTCAAIGMMPDRKEKKERERIEFIERNTVGIEEAIIPSSYDYEDIAGITHGKIEIPLMPDELEELGYVQYEKPPTNEEGKTDFSNMLEDIL